MNSRVINRTRRPLTLIAYSVFLFVVPALVAGFLRRNFEPRFEELLSSAVHSVATGSTDAERLARRALARNSDSAEANWLLGSVLASREDRFGALACFGKIPNDHAQSPKARLAEGNLLFDLGDAVAAEVKWRAAAAHPAIRPDAAARLMVVAAFQLRRAEWRSFVWEMIEAQRAGVREHVHMSISHYVIWQGENIIETLEAFVRGNKQDHLSRSSLVRHLLGVGRSDEARPHLESLLAADPSSKSTALAVMSFAVAEAEPKLFDDFVRSAPEELKRELATDSDWRRGEGELHLLRASPSQALPHLEASARVAPFHPTTRQQLSLAYRLSGRAKDAELHAAAAAVLARLDRNCHSIQNFGAYTPDQVHEVARDAASIGMVDEAKAWVRFARKSDPNHERLKSLDALLQRSPSSSVASPPAEFLDPRKCELPQ
jgi:hypothetical protein